MSHSVAQCPSPGVPRPVRYASCNQQMRIRMRAGQLTESVDKQMWTFVLRDLTDVRKRLRTGGEKQLKGRGQRRKVDRGLIVDHRNALTRHAALTHGACDKLRVRNEP